MTWLAENGMSVLLLFIVGLIVFFILRAKIRARKSARGCGCGCAGCSGCSACATHQSHKSDKSSVE